MTDPQTESGAAPLLERAAVRIEPPIDQIAPREWAALLAEGTVTGTVSADDDEGQVLTMSILEMDLDGEE